MTDATAGTAGMSTPASPAIPGASADGSGPDAQIFDRGYRRYTGERTGIEATLGALVKHSLRHALGIGRATRHKVVPIAIVLMAYLPATAFIGFAALIPVGTEDFLPTYAEYYGFVAATIYLLAGFTAPVLLCTDRRTGLLGVYLASPLTRPTYLLGKGISVLGLLLLVTLGPPLLMLIAFTLQDLGPDGFGAWMTQFARIIASSLIIGALYTSVALAISASTDRTVVATATILALIPGSGIITDVMVLEAGVTPVARLANLLFLPRAIVFRIHNEPGGWPSVDNPTWTLWLAWAAWTLAGVGWVWFRYRKLLVRR